MKALVLSDFHGASIRTKVLIDQTDPDLIILPGDIPSTIDLPTLGITMLRSQNRAGYIKNLYSRFIDRINLKQIHSIKRILDDLMEYNLPIVMIHGNTETPEIRNWLKLYALRNPLINYIADNHVKIADYLFIGHGWIPKIKGNKRMSSPGEIDSDRCKKILLDTLGRAKQSAMRHILVSHAPPFGTAIDYLPHKQIHAGSRIVRTFMDDGHFDGIISGHLHEAFGSIKKDDWWAVNAGAVVEDTACLIDLELNKIKWIHNFTNNSIETLIYSNRVKFNYDS